MEMEGFLYNINITVAAVWKKIIDLGANQLLGQTAWD